MPDSPGGHRGSTTAAAPGKPPSVPRVQRHGRVAIRTCRSGGWTGWLLEGRPKGCQGRTVAFPAPSWTFAISEKRPSMRKQDGNSASDRLTPPLCGRREDSERRTVATGTGTVGFRDSFPCATDRHNAHHTGPAYGACHPDWVVGGNPKSHYSLDHRLTAPSSRSSMIMSLQTRGRDC